jgi:hypothetical protein
MEVADRRPTGESLREYLHAQIRKHQLYALVRRLIVWTLLLAAVLLGSLVVVNVGTKWFTADQLSALTGAGAILLALLRLGKFQEQAAWNKIKQRRLEGLYRRLLFEGAEEKLISAELSQVNEQLEKMRVWLEIPGELSTFASEIPRGKGTAG